MIDPQRLRRLAMASKDRVVIDHRGEPIEVAGLPEDTPTPAILVGPVSEAVKQAENDMIVAHLDRDGLWAVQGLVLAPELISELPDEIDSAAALISAVTAAGFLWQVVETPGDSRWLG